MSILRHLAFAPVALLAVLLVADARADASGEEQFFESHVRPLLVQRCLNCHGEKKQQADLRLDSREAMLRGTEGTPAIIAGQPEKSRLLQVVHYAEDDTQMPPAGKLPDHEIEILTKWIAAGAFWPDSEKAPEVVEDPFPRTPAGDVDFAAAAQSHWSYRPVSMPPLPAVQDADRVQSPIDRFLLRQLESTDLSFSEDADRRTLIRRATFDLIGIPPTFEEVEAFAADPSPTAYESLIDRLLASPLYGQRWARHWLDVARYADTKGYSFTADPRYPYAYTFRDYVVNSLNDDKPYDRFVIEQLAADKLGLAENNSNLAALGFLTVGPWFRGDVHNIIDDRIDVVMRGFMGMTAGCARCHDHKYDPIPSEDYYSLYGVFASSREPEELPVIGALEETPEYLAYREELAKRQRAVDEYVQATFDKLLQQAREQVTDYLLAVVVAAKKVPPGVEVTYENGKLQDALTRLWMVTIAERLKRNDPVFLPWQALAALSPEEFPKQVEDLIAKYDAVATGETPAVNPRVWDALRKSPPQSMVDVARLYGRLLTAADAEWTALVESSGEDSSDQLPDASTEELRRVLSGPGSITEKSVDERLFGRDHRNQVQKLRRKVSEWHTESPGAPPRAMLLVDKDQPVSPVVFLRGTPSRRGPAVPRRFPRVLGGADSPDFTDGSGRLELARGIADRDNPLTARVLVNRVWMHHFGSPLVSTPSDFGTRSDPPTHPELLDWLAASFMEHDWSLKWLHREIMSSTAYRQSSRVSATQSSRRAEEIDPENRLLWRMNRRRLEFEPMRDAMLVASGQLNPALGGRPIDIEKHPESGRRSIYTFIDRNNFSPLLRTFDFPTPDVHAARRPNTSVPQQTLYAMNADFPQRTARLIAERPEVTSRQTAEERISALYRIILARNPEAMESELAIRYLESNGLVHQFAQALLLTNEFLFID